eukprot:TRINITY_DN11265_c0_g1_i1.p1 TRINITY_DN11265_c0_g1~~TRINITY_DN11265_c0_g1_i1.p1  ORF type:complete len:769 (+),score=128.56 TRINITY_DN11265_c0_g1_i1:225-2309(+)
MTRFRDQQHPLEHLLRGATPMFFKWSASEMKAVMDQMTAVSYAPGEIIVYHKQPCGSGLLFVQSGSVSLQSCGNVINCDAPLFAIGAAAIVTDEESPVRVTAESEVDCWVLSKNTFAKLIPPHLEDSLVSDAFQWRTDIMHRNFSMNPSLMRKSVLLKTWPEHLLNYLVSRLKPLVLRKGYVLAPQGQRITAILFIMRGTCETVCTTKDGISIATETTDSVIGDIDIIIGDKRTSSLRCKTTCDCWSLSEVDLKYVMNDELSKGSHQVAFVHRSVWMQKEGYKLLPFFLLNVPFFAKLLTSRAIVEDVTKIFTPQMYHSKQVVASVSSLCTRVILVFRGCAAAVSLSDDVIVRKLHEGECMGDTGLIQQRWRHLIIATTITDCWECKVSDLRDVLLRHNMLDVATGFALDLIRQDEKLRCEERPSWFTPPPHTMRHTAGCRVKLWELLSRDSIGGSLGVIMKNLDGTPSPSLTILWPTPPSKPEEGKKSSFCQMVTSNICVLRTKRPNEDVNRRPMAKQDWTKYLKDIADDTSTAGRAQHEREMCNETAALQMKVEKAVSGMVRRYDEGKKKFMPRPKERAKSKSSISAFHNIPMLNLTKPKKRLKMTLTPSKPRTVAQQARKRNVRVSNTSDSPFVFSTTFAPPPPVASYASEWLSRTAAGPIPEGYNPYRLEWNRARDINPEQAKARTMGVL